MNVAPLVVAGTLLALALVAPAVQAWPPVCIERDATVLRTSAHVWANCGVGAEISHCPPVGYGPCWLVTTETLP